MDDLLVIIITLLIAGFGIIGQFKKKRPNPETENEDGISNDIMELFNIPSGNPKYKRGYANQYETIEEEPKPKVKEQRFNFDPNKEGGTFTKTVQKPSAPINNVDSKTKNKFPLRKAVIYSEILNRKYT